MSSVRVRSTPNARAIVESFFIEFNRSWEQIQVTYCSLTLSLKTYLDIVVAQFVNQDSDRIKRIVSGLRGRHLSRNELQKRCLARFCLVEPTRATRLRCSLEACAWRVDGAESAKRALQSNRA